MQTVPASFNIHQCNDDMLLLTVPDRHRLAGQKTCHAEMLCYTSRLKRHGYMVAQKELLLWICFKIESFFLILIEISAIADFVSACSDRRPKDNSDLL